MQMIDLNGTRIAYTERGSGPPVLFVHGSGAYSEIFEPVLDELPADIRAIAFDRRGFGASGGPPAGRLERHIEDAAALLEALDARSATVVGSSSGGVLALRLALARPDLVSALALLEPPYQMALVPSASATATIIRVNLRWLLRRDAEGAALAFYRWTTRYATGGNQFDAYPEKWKRTALGHARTALREVIQVALPIPARSALQRLTQPTSVLIGDLGLPVFHRTARRALRAMPTAREVAIPGAAHLLYTDQPAACAAAIVDAVASAAGDVPSSLNAA